MTKKIILPLDNLTWEESLPILKKTQDLVWGYKLRRVILEKGINIIQEIKPYGNVMVDFKLYDIPSAIKESIELHFNCGADISTVHITSCFQPEMYGVAGVTSLTSFTKEEWYSWYRTDLSIPDTVKEMCEFADLSKYSHIVCSPQELNNIQKVKAKKITPGIRPLWYTESDDQTRVGTPAKAIEMGADLLVIGRPLLKSDNIVDAIKKTNEEINAVL